MALTKMEIFALEMVTFYMRCGTDLSDAAKATLFDDLMDMIGKYVDGC